MEDRQEIKEHYTNYLGKFTEYHFNKANMSMNYLIILQS